MNRRFNPVFWILMGSAAGMLFGAGCALRDAYRLPVQSNSAFNETLRDCVYRKLIEEPAWCPAEDQCVRPVVNRAEIEAHEASCRKEGAR